MAKGNDNKPQADSAQQNIPQKDVQQNAAAPKPAKKQKFFVPEF